MNRLMNPDRWSSVVCLIISVILIVALPSQTSDSPLPGVRGFEVLDGAFFPKIALVLFVIASVWLFIEARPRLVRTRAESEAGTGSLQATPSEQEIATVTADGGVPGMGLRDLLLSAGLPLGVLCYVQVFEFTGYLLTSIIGVSLLAVVCGQRSWVGLFCGGVVFTTIVYFLFSRLFLVPLPRGTLWFG